MASIGAQILFCTCKQFAGGVAQQTSTAATNFPSRYYRMRLVP